MGMKKWLVESFDKNLAKELADECDIDPITALIASSRGYSDPAELEQFLSDEPCFADPRELADIAKASDIINSEIQKDAKIAVYGDYDCDGVTATAMLYGYLKKRGADCLYYIPDRFSEGYGMNISAVDFLKMQNTELIITVDNGIASAEAIAHAKELGMLVVVTDHHLPPEKLPPADAVVDPHRRDCPSSFKDICGAQVAFKLICVLEGKEPEELLSDYADLLAAAVTADVMPLRYENRDIVRAGLDKLRYSPSVGLSALLNSSGITKDNLSAGKIAFTIAPRLNAAGRMASASEAVDLLCCDNMLKALEAATKIENYNTKRQQTEKEILAEAVEIIEKNGYFNDRVIVVDGIGWHHGVIGIVASKLAEKYGCPAIVISSDGETAVGSGRSFEGFSLYDAMASCSELFLKFGGHELAAGITFKSKDISIFRTRINDYAFNTVYVPPTLKLDCRVNPAGLTVDLAEAVAILEPFGNGNQQPVFGVYGAALDNVIPVGKGRHLRLIFSKEGYTFQAFLFGVMPEQFCFEPGEILDVAVTAELGFYNGAAELKVIVRALRMNGTDDDKLFSDKDNYTRYITGRDFEPTLLPSRVQVGEIYKFICAKPVSEERIIYKFVNSVGYAKTMIALKTLSELDLITENGGVYSSVPSNIKTDLKNSETYRSLLERSERA